MIQNVFKTPQCTDMESTKGGVLSIFQTTQIKLELKDCIFLVNYLGIQLTPKLFSTLLFQKNRGKLERPTVTSAKRHQTKY